MAAVVRDTINNVAHDRSCNSAVGIDAAPPSDHHRSPPMRVFIAGIDGYLGWSLAVHLTAREHEVAGTDLFLRRRWVEEMGSQSAIPISTMGDRLAALEGCFGKT